MSGSGRAATHADRCRPRAATRLEISIGGISPSAEFAIALRFGAAPSFNPVNSDYPAAVNLNPLVVTTASSPPLRAGTYYIGFIFVRGPAQTATITATVSSGPLPLTSG